MIITGIIPARYASTRFPGKPLADIHGKPMIQRVYERASAVLENVCVATDDMRIFDIVTNFGGNAVMTSPDHPSGTDRCAEAIDIFEQQTKTDSDIIINIQGDEPFIHPEQIEQLVDIFKNNSSADIATLVKNIDDNDTLFNPNKVKVVTAKDAKALYFSRNTIPYFRECEKDNWLDKHNFLVHIGMYGYRKNVLKEICKLPKGSLEKAESLEQLRWLENGYTIYTSVTDKESIGIDTPDDLEKALSQL